MCRNYCVDRGPALLPIRGVHFPLQRGVSSFKSLILPWSLFAIFPSLIIARLASSCICFFCWLWTCGGSSFDSDFFCLWCFWFTWLMQFSYTSCTSFDNRFRWSSLWFYLLVPFVLRLWFLFLLSVNRIRFLLLPLVYLLCVCVGFVIKVRWFLSRSSYDAGSDLMDFPLGLKLLAIFVSLNFSSPPVVVLLACDETTFDNF